MGATYKRDAIVRPPAIVRLARLGPRRMLLLAEALLGLGMAAAAVACLSYRRAVGLGTRSLGRQRSAEEDTLIDNVLRALKSAASRVPFRAKCIEQGIALTWMLRRRGIDARLVYGARLGAKGNLDAHVWVTIGDQTILGGEGAAGFHQLAMHPELPR